MKEIYSFYKDDLPTEIVLEKLKELDIPFTTKTTKAIRENLHNDKIYDDILTVYVEPEHLVLWLENLLDKTINEYGETQN